MEFDVLAMMISSYGVNYSTPSGLGHPAMTNITQGVGPAGPTPAHALVTAKDADPVRHPAKVSTGSTNQ